jgi:transketolase
MTTTALLKPTRDAVGETLKSLMAENPRIVVLTADLAESTRVSEIEEIFPERFIQVGVAEQNMAGIAAGLSMEGKIPVITSFSAFSPYGNWTQIRTSICYSKENVKIIGTHSGFSAASDGATHQALEDVALMRVLPEMTVLSPVDFEEAKKALKAAVEIEGPVYIRLFREATEVITTKNTDFTIGKAEILKSGKDITIIGSGPVVVNALKAAEQLLPQIDCEVINCSSIKPLDSKTITESAKKTRKIIVVEEHQIAGGLGSAVCELVSEEFPVTVKVIGAKDTFGESGSYDELLKKHGMDVENISKTITKFVKEKP